MEDTGKVLLLQNNNNSPHAYVPLNQPTMAGNPSPSTYMPYQPTIIGMSHYGNAPSYGKNQGPFSQATRAYQ